jgi:S-adenosylmethionine/arginine decarboxylase-like enzyme
MPEHKHMIVRAEVTEPITEVDVAKEWMTRLVEKIGMKITEHGGPHCDYVDKSGNQGITVMAMIETSHCAAHIWDKRDPPLVQLDVYSCAEFETWDIIEFIYEMGPSKIEFKLFDRAKHIDEITKPLKMKAQ